MDKRQQKLIDILENEWLMDKEFKFGCIVYDLNHWDNSEKVVVYTVLSADYQPILGKMKLYNVWWFPDYSRTPYFFPIDRILNEKNKFRDSGENKWDNRYKIIWQYHLWSILQLLRKKHCIFNWSVSEEWYLSVDNYKTGITKRVGINTITPPMERSEQQNKELVLFIESLQND